MHRIVGRTDTPYGRAYWVSNGGRFTIPWGWVGVIEQSASYATQPSEANVLSAIAEGSSTSTGSDQGTGEVVTRDT